MKFREFSNKSEGVLNWIHKHIDLIDENKWNEVYEYLTRSAITYHAVTEALYEAGIEPLDYLEYVPEDYLSNNPNVIEIEIPEGIKSISESAFFNCERITEIELPKSIESIGDWALSGMDNLESIYIPGKLEYLGHLAIHDDDSLYRIYSIAENKDLLFKEISRLKDGSCKFVEID